MKMFWSRVSYGLRRTLTYVVACKLVNNHCTLCQFHTWWSHQRCWGSNVAQRGTQWSHRTARSVPCVCVPWSWSPPGAALVQLGWLHIEGMWPSDCPEAFATIWWMPPDRPRSTQVVPFFFLPSRCLVTAWVGGGGKTREENQREILAVKSQLWDLGGDERWRAPLAAAFLERFFTFSRIKKKKKKNLKHSASAIDLNIFLSYKRRKLLLF